MRWLVLLLALAGVAGSGLLGLGFMVSLRDRTRSVVQADIDAGKAGLGDEKFAKLSRFTWSYLFLFGGAALGLIGAFYALARRKYTAFLMFLLSVAVPAALAIPYLLDGPEVLNLTIFGSAINEQLAKITGVSDSVKGFVILTGGFPLAALLSLLIGRPRPPVEDEEDQ
jgi:hypothetical protein